MGTGIHHQLVASLSLWSLLSLGAAVIGQGASTGPWWRSFWLMTGLWGLVDGAIAWYALVRPPLAPAELAPILRLNAGLDVLYLLAGGLLCRREKPETRGFGAAILVQGAFLLGFDLLFFLRCLR